MSVHPNFFRAASLLALTEGALRVKGLVLLPFLTRHFGPVDYGAWTQVALVSGMIIPLLMAGLDSAVARFLPGRTDEEVRREFSAVLVYVAVVSGVAAVACLLAAGPLASTIFGDSKNASLMILAGGFVAVGLGTTTARMYFRVVGRAGVYAAANVGQALMSTGLTIAAIAAGGDLVVVVGLVLLGDGIILLILLAVIAFDGGIGPPNMRVLPKLLRFGVVLIPFAYAMVVINLIDRLFLVQIKGLEAVGIYGVAYSLGYLLIALIFNPIWVMYPTKAAELHNTGQTREVSVLARQSLRLTLGLMIPAITGWYVLARPIMVLVASPEFVDGAHVVPLIAIAYSLHMVSSFYGTALILTGRHFWLSVSLVAAAIVNIILNVLLIPPFGIAGAAWATLAAFAVQLAIDGWLGSRAIPLNMDWVFLAKAGLSSAVMGALVWIIPGADYTGLMMRTTAGIAIFSVSMLAMRAVTLREIIMAIKVWRGDRESVGPGHVP